MKILFIIFLSFISVFSTESEKVRLNWEEGRKLSWNDFRGKPFVGDYIASTNSGISFKFSYKYVKGKVLLDYTINSIFYPELSWHKPNLVNDQVLNHEQAHFDISELYARKLGKKIEHTRFTRNVEKELEIIYKETERQRREMQSTFDRETKHAIDKQAEKKWEAYIRQQLKKYERWK